MGDKASTGVGAEKTKEKTVWIYMEILHQDYEQPIPRILEVKADYVIQLRQISAAVLHAFIGI